jgi:membrane protease YdiL (CAAX protease family)
MRFTIRSAVGLGIIAFFLAVLPGGVWTVLLVTNLRTNANIPWAVAAMGIILWVMWQYLDGRGPPASTSETRHRLLRAALISAPRFAWALLAGILSIIALAGLWIVLLQLVRWPSRVLPDFSKYPLFTVVTVIAMACVVSAIPEEAGFRGYFQAFLERKLSGPAAIVTSALVIAPAHCLTQGFLWPVMLFYFLVDSMLGTIAYLTKSIVPGIAVHSTGLLVFFTLIWPYDATRPFISDGGANGWFWIHVAQIFICGVLALLTFWRLKLTAGCGRPGPDQALQPAADRLENYEGEIRK